jgi:hypothetical protein
MYTFANIMHTILYMLADRRCPLRHLARQKAGRPIGFVYEPSLRHPACFATRDPRLEPHGGNYTCQNCCGYHRDNRGQQPAANQHAPRRQHDRCSRHPSQTVTRPRQLHRAERAHQQNKRRRDSKIDKIVMAETECGQQREDQEQKTTRSAPAMAVAASPGRPARPMMYASMARNCAGSGCNPCG